MVIEAGTKLRITHARKGTFECIAVGDFDPDTEAFFPVKLAANSEVEGMSRGWAAGDEIPCRREFVLKWEVEH